MSSIVADVPNGASYPYTSSKAAVKSLGEGLRDRLRSQGSQVTVNVLCPGFVRTPLTDANDFAMPFILDSAEASQVRLRGG